MGASCWEVLVKLPSSTKITLYIIQVLRVVRPVAWCLGLPTRYKSNQIKSNQIQDLSYKLKCLPQQNTLLDLPVCVPLKPLEGDFLVDIILGKVAMSAGAGGGEGGGGCVSTSIHIQINSIITTPQNPGGGMGREGGGTKFHYICNLTWINIKIVTHTRKMFLSSWC